MLVVRVKTKDELDKELGYHWEYITIAWISPMNPLFDKIIKVEKEFNNIFGEFIFKIIEPTNFKKFKLRKCWVTVLDSDLAKKLYLND